MKTIEQIKEELKIREDFKNPESYSNYRINQTVIQTLKWVLHLPSSIKSHHKNYEN